MKKKFYKVWLLAVLILLGVGIVNAQTYHTITPNVNGTNYETYIAEASLTPAWIKISGAVSTNGSATIPNGWDGFLTPVTAGLGVRSSRTVTFNVTNCVSVAVLGYTNKSDLTRGVYMTITASDGSFDTEFPCEGDGTSVLFKDGLNSALNYTVKIHAGSDGDGAVFQQIRFEAPSSCTPVTTLSSFTEANVSKYTTSSSFTNPFSKGNNQSDPTYSSSEESVATVAANGTVTIIGIGTTTITATQAADATYCATSASYALTVTAPPPTLSALPNSLAGFSCPFEGGPSTSQSFTLTGENLAAGNLTLSIPDSYEASLSETEDYVGTSLAIPIAANGTVDCTIYVRLVSSGDSDGERNGNITISGGSASSITVNCEGTLTATSSGGDIPMGILVAGDYTGNYGQKLKSYGNKKYEVYSFYYKKSSSLQGFYAIDGDNTPYRIAKITGDDPPFIIGGGENDVNWIKGTISSYTQIQNKADEDAAFLDDSYMQFGGVFASKINMRNSSSIQLKVKGYDQFSILGNDQQEGNVESKLKKLMVLIEEVAENGDRTVLYSNADDMGNTTFSIRDFALDPSKVNLITISGGPNSTGGNNVISAFSLRLPTLTWIGGNTGSETSWITAENWYDPSNTGGAGAGRIPEAYDHVIIPTTPVGQSDIANSAGYFPILQDTDDAKCYSIAFEPGAELGNQHLLTYQEASVMFELSKSTRWHMISLPIAARLSDFHFRDNDPVGPYAWLKEFTPTETTSGWTYRTIPINSTSYDLPLGEGSAISIGDFFDNKVQEWADDYTVELSGRLHSSEEFMKTLAFGPDNGSYFALAGNPFMTSIDFDALYGANNSKIKPCYMVWTEIGSTEGFAGYLYNPNDGNSYNFGITPAPTTISETNANYIAPFQAFFVEREDYKSGEELVFNQSIIAPGTSSSGKGTLRSASSDDFGKLDIIAKNGTVPVKTFIANNENMTSARKLKNGCKAIPDIYTLTEEAGIALGAQIIDTDNTVRIPIGIATSYDGDMSLTFSGMSGFDNTNIILSDELTGESINLSDISEDSYTYNFSYTPPTENGKIAAEESRFYIAFSPTGITDVNGIDSFSQESVSVSANGSTIRAFSAAADPIRHISVYDAQGRVLYTAGNLDTPDYTINLPQTSNVYIVKVLTDNIVKNVRLAAIK